LLSAFFRPIRFGGITASKRDIGFLIFPIDFNRFIPEKTSLFS